MNAPCGCFDPDSSSLVISGSNYSTLWNFPPFDMLEYDTFWTIGKLSLDTGQTPFGGVVKGIHPIGNIANLKCTMEDSLFFTKQ